VTDDVVGECACVAALLHGVSHDRQCATGVGLDERFDEFVERCDIEGLAAAGGDKFECGHRVASGTATLAEHRLQRGIAEVDAGIASQPPNVLFHHIHRE